MIRHLGLFNNRTERDAALDEGTLQEPFIVYYTETVQTTITQTVEDDDIPEIQHYTPNNPEPEPAPEEPYININFDVLYLDANNQTGYVESIDYGNFTDLATIHLFKFKESDLVNAVNQDPTLDADEWKMENALVGNISVDDDSIDNYLPIELTYDPDFTPFEEDELDGWSIELHMFDSDGEVLMTYSSNIPMHREEEEPEEPEELLLRLYTDVDYMTEQMFLEDETGNLGSVYLDINDEQWYKSIDKVVFYMYDIATLEDARNLAMQEGEDFDEEEWIELMENGVYTTSELQSMFASEDGGPVMLSVFGYMGVPTIVNSGIYIMKAYKISTDKSGNVTETLVEEQTVSIDMEPIPEPPVEDPEPPVE